MLTLHTGAAVAVMVDAGKVPADISQRERLQAILQDRATPEQLAEFAHFWQERVRRMLLEHADDPAMIRAVPLGVTVA